MGCFREIAPVLGATLGSVLLPGLGTALGSSIGGLSTIGGALGGLAGGAATGASGSGLLFDALGGGIAPNAGDIFNGISGGVSDLYNGSALQSGLSDIGSSLGNSISDLFDPSSTGSGLTSDFASGLGGAPTLDPTIDAARSSVGAAASTPSVSSIGATPGTGLGAVGGGSSGGFFNAPDTAIGSFDQSFDPSSVIGNGPDISGQLSAGLEPNVGASGFDLSSTGGSKVAPGLASLFGGGSTGGGSSQLLNGLLRSGVAGLLNNPNNKGFDAQINAGNQIQSDYQPFLNSGIQANNTLSDLYGLNGQDAGAQAAARADFANTPGYQFTLGQGVAAQDASAAAKGNILSGNQQKALTDYGQGVASTGFNQYIQNLQNQAAQGQAAAGGVATGQSGVANAQAGKSGASANNQNTSLAGILTALFPQNGISFGNGGANFTSGNQGILQSLFG